MSRHIDDALDAIDRVLGDQSTTELSYEPHGTDDPTVCWRCTTAPAGDGPSGVCPACRAVLLDEAAAAPPVHHRPARAVPPGWAPDAIRDLTAAVYPAVRGDHRPSAHARMHGYEPHIVIVDEVAALPDWQALTDAINRCVRQVVVAFTPAIEGLNAGLVRLLEAVKNAPTAVPPVPAKPAQRRRYRP